MYWRGTLSTRHVHSRAPTSLGDFGVKILFGDRFSVIWRPVQVLATEPDAAEALERCVDYIRR